MENYKSSLRFQIIVSIKKKFTYHSVVLSSIVVQNVAFLNLIISYYES